MQRWIGCRRALRTRTATAVRSRPAARSWGTEITPCCWAATRATVRSGGVFGPQAPGLLIEQTPWRDAGIRASVAPVALRNHARLRQDSRDRRALRLGLRRAPGVPRLDDALGCPQAPRLLEQLCELDRVDGLQPDEDVRV